MADDVILWHNPRCSKSRTALKLLEEKGQSPTVRLYLKDPPDEDEIAAVLDRLGLRPRDLMRRGEAAFQEAGLTEDAADDILIAAMAAHPILIERPVAIRGDRAVIGRPPESVLDLL
jgi:arsenate reductase